MVNKLLIVIYATGLRLNEALSLTLGDVDTAQSLIIVEQTKFYKSRLVPFGDQLRRCPLWHDTVSELTPLIEGRGQDEHVFLNRRKEPITRFGIHTWSSGILKNCFLNFHL